MNHETYSALRTATTTLTQADVRDLLAGFAAAIELDQIRVDALPAQRFHPIYDDDMWRRCRRDHLDLIDQLLSTVAKISTSMLRELTCLAIAYDPTVVRDRNGRLVRRGSERHVCTRGV